MQSVIAALSERLRDLDPAVRLSGARRLTETVDRFGNAALPALLASLDAAAAEPPPRKATSLHHALNRAWHTALRRAPEAAASWYAAMIDKLCGYDFDDPQETPPFAHLLATLRNDPEGGSYAPLLRLHLPRIVGLLGSFAAAAEETSDATDSGRDRGQLIDALVHVAVHHAGRDEELLVSIIDVLPELVCDATEFRGHFINLVTRDHPRQPVVARVIDTAVRRSALSHHSAHIFGALILREAQGDLGGLCEHLRPRAARWSDAQLDIFVRHTLLDFEDRGLDLIGTLRRAPARRLLPQMLTNLGRTTPAMTELAKALAESHRPVVRATGPAGGGVPFRDLNFKLAVINELMYEQNVLSPSFDVWAFAAGWPEREILDGADGPIPEVLRYFAELPLTPQDLEHVTTLWVAPSSRIYHQVDPLWGGEEDWFDVHSFEDAAHLPNLRTLNIDYMIREKVDPGPLRRRGVDVNIHFED